MKRLYVLRHAKAVGYTDTDHERSLAERGFRQVQNMSSKLRDSAIDYALVSDAERTRQTFAGLNLPFTAHVTREAYNATQDQLETLVRLSPADATKVLLVAHNPGLSDLVSAAGASHSLSTCDLAILEFDGEWIDFVGELARCVEIVHPDAE